VKRIEPDRVVVSTRDEEHSIDNDAVIVCAGGILPTPFLKSVGITVDTRYGTA
jgi:hypothetical protein